MRRGARQPAASTPASLMVPACGAKVHSHRHLGKDPRDGRGSTSGVVLPRSNAPGTPCREQAGGVSLQVREAACPASSARVVIPSLVKMWERCTLTVLGG
jgi:hypothetical protein